MILFLYDFFAMELSKALVDKICYEINNNERFEHNKETLRKTTYFLEDNALEALATIENEKFNLLLPNLKKITDRQANDISKFKWSFIDIWGLDNITIEQLKLLSQYNWRIEIWWFNSISDDMILILRQFQNDLILNFGCRRGIITASEVNNLIVDVKKVLNQLYPRPWFVKVIVDNDEVMKKFEDELSMYDSRWIVIEKN